jgi:FAD/FMN-containing dehydrogenase
MARPEEVAAEMAEITGVLAAAGASAIRVSKDERERLLLWSGRKAAFPRDRPDHARLLLHGRHHSAARPCSRAAANRGMDAQIRPALRQRVPRRRRQPSPLIMYDANIEAQRVGAEAFGAEILELCIEVGGTITGEHGVGIEKLPQMCVQFRGPELECFLGVKAAFDPQSLLNPGKGVPVLSRCAEFGKVHVHHGSSRIPSCLVSDSELAMPVQTPNRLHRPDAKDVADLVTRLAADYGDRAQTSRSIRDQHSHGEGLADSGLPDVVVFPHTNEEVAAIVRLCHAARVPVIAFGVGTSLEGHVAALYGGVCVDLSQMNRVLEVNAEDLDCRVQAGRAARAAQRRAQGYRALLSH